MADFHVMTKPSIAGLLGCHGLLQAAWCQQASRCTEMCTAGSLEAAGDTSYPFCLLCERQASSIATEC